MFLKFCCWLANKTTCKQESFIQVNDIVVDKHLVIRFSDLGTSDDMANTSSSWIFVHFLPLWLLSLLLQHKVLLVLDVWVNHCCSFFHVEWIFPENVYPLSWMGEPDPPKLASSVALSAMDKKKIVSKGSFKNHSVWHHVTRSQVVGCVCFNTGVTGSKDQSGRRWHIWF